MATTDPRRAAVWFVLDDQDPHGIETWTESILAAQNVPVDSAGEHAHALRALALASVDEDLPLRAFCLMNGTTGLMFEIGCFTSSSADWARDQLTILRALSAGALREEVIDSAEVSGIESTIVFSTHPDDPDEPLTEDRAVFGRVCAAARQPTPSGRVDLVGRAIHDNPDVLELFTYPLMSFLHGAGLIAAVQAE